MDATEALATVLDEVDLSYEDADYGEEGWVYFNAEHSGEVLAPEVMDGLRKLGFQIVPL